MENRNRYFYCYNLKQAKFFKDNGVKEVDFDINSKNKRTYFIFDRGESNHELDWIFELWNKNKN